MTRHPNTPLCLPVHASYYLGNPALCIKLTPQRIHLPQRPRSLLRPPITHLSLLRYHSILGKYHGYMKVNAYFPSLPVYLRCHRTWLTSLIMS